MKKISCKCFNQETRKVEQFINNEFWKDVHPMQDISSTNVKIITRALMEVHSKDYCIDHIDLTPFSSDGLIIEMKIDVLDDWKGKEADYNFKQRLYAFLADVVEVLGKPTHIFKADKSFYAEWTRNMVTWF